MWTWWRDPFRPIAALLGATCLALAAVLALQGSSPQWQVVLVLGGLYALAENQDVRLPNDSSISAGFMLAMAGVVVFRSEGAILGPLLVGLCGGLYLEHIRTRQWAKVVTNSSIFALSSLAAALVFELIPAQAVESIPGQLIAALPIGLTFSLVNFVLLVPVVAAANSTSYRAVARDLWLGDLQIYPFALMGLLLGELYLDLGLWVVPLFVTPIFIARQAFASYLAMRDAQDAALALLVRTLESKDRYTAGHVERVARFAVYMGEEFKFRPGRLERLRYAALMHDIGKLIVPNQILNKPGRLTAEEYERVRLHDAASVTLLGRIDFLAPVVPSLDLAHVPRGSDADVPLEARIIMVADAFDAMTSTRSYRRALEQDVAFAELRDKSGGQFDLACVEALAAALEQRGERYGSGHEEERVEFAAPPPAAGTGSAGLGDLAGESEAVGR